MSELSSADPPLQNAYLLDWWLVLGRQFTNHARRRGAITLPKRIAEMADLTGYVRVETDDENSDQYIIRSSEKYHGVATTLIGRNDTSVQIPFPDAMRSRIPFNVGDMIALELDLRTPEEGMILREFDEYDAEHTHSLSTPVLADAVSTWGSPSE